MVELVAPSHFRALLREPALKEDPSTSQQAEQLPTYNAYSIDGDVTAPLVFVNYGVPEDYDRLARLGISVKGAIVIAKYGGSWRGIKPKVAAEHGAVGCLIYSDPSGDGYHAGDVYPKGPFRDPNKGYSGGACLDMPLYRRRPAHSGGRCYARCEAAPALRGTDDHQDSGAATLLRRCAATPRRHRRKDGSVDWAGALPITYHIGPGPARVHLRVQSDWRLATVRDVIGRIPGTSTPSNGCSEGTTTTPGSTELRIPSPGW